MTAPQDRCWSWIGAHRTWDGRALFGNRLAAPLVYQMVTGDPIPQGLNGHHICRNKGCVNPSHLEWLTASDHAIEHSLGGDLINAIKTHCPQGHEYTQENTYLWFNKNNIQQRRCKTCRRKQYKKYNDKKRGKKNG